jgi:hypothetical protein
MTALNYPGQVAVRAMRRVEERFRRHFGSLAANLRMPPHDKKAALVCCCRKTVLSDLHKAELLAAHRAEMRHFGAFVGEG